MPYLFTIIISHPQLPTYISHSMGRKPLHYIPLSKKHHNLMNEMVIYYFPMNKKLGSLPIPSSFLHNSSHLNLFLLTFHYTIIFMTKTMSHIQTPHSYLTHNYNFQFTSYCILSCSYSLAQFP